MSAPLSRDQTTHAIPWTTPRLARPRPRETGFRLKPTSQARKTRHRLLGPNQQAIAGGSGCVPEDDAIPRLRTKYTRGLVLIRITLLTGFGMPNKSGFSSIFSNTHSWMVQRKQWKYYEILYTYTYIPSCSRSYNGLVSAVY